jgi:hypothetical protein
MYHLLSFCLGPTSGDYTRQLPTHVCFPLSEHIAVPSIFTSVMSFTNLQPADSLSPFLRQPPTYDEAKTAFAGAPCNAERPNLSS